MSSKKRYDLLKIRGLMVVSLVLLIVLISNWLYTQYKEQKEELKKDLELALVNTEQNLGDSLILANIINPIIKNRAVNIKTDVHTGTGLNIKSSAALKFIIEDKDSGAELTQLKHVLTTVENTNTNTVQTVSVNGKKTTTTRIIVNPAAGSAQEDLIKPVIDLLLKKMLPPGDAKRSELFKIDTTTLQKAFSNKMKADDRGGFAVIWYDSVAKKSRQTGNPIYLKSDLPYGSYNVSIAGYTGYLCKKITPQILFSILLLSVITAAFIITYKTLKEQITLAAIRNDLISNMSHELKTPISTVKLALEALDNFNRIEDTQITRDYLGMAAAEMNRLDGLVNRALNAALLEGGKMAIQKETGDLKNLTEDVLQDMKLRFQQANAVVHLSTTGNDFETRMDKLHIQGVLINLLDNSLKYSVTQPVIELHLSESTTGLILSVSDNGPGIPAEYIKRVFDKFFRVPAGDSHNIKGYGLGLNYSKQIVELHGGKITVANNETHGCTITITLPKDNA